MAQKRSLEPDETEGSMIASVGTSLFVAVAAVTPSRLTEAAGAGAPLLMLGGAMAAGAALGAGAVGSGVAMLGGAVVSGGGTLLGGSFVSPHKKRRAAEAATPGAASDASSTALVLAMRPTLAQVEAAPTLKLKCERYLQRICANRFFGHWGVWNPYIDASLGGNIIFKKMIEAAVAAADDSSGERYSEAWLLGQSQRYLQDICDDLGTFSTPESKSVLAKRIMTAQGKAEADAAEVLAFLKDLDRSYDLALDNALEPDAAKRAELMGLKDTWQKTSSSKQKVQKKVRDHSNPAQN
eukprot:COSAG04_NODE_842_length_9945_cov_4.243043_5_plen_296_part_00